MSGARKEGDNEVDDWIKVVDRLPFVSSVKRDVIALRRLLYDRRAPRVAAIGLEGSGRTSLANALLSAVAFGEGGAAPGPEAGRWIRIDADGRRLEWLELPAEGDADALLEMARPAFEERLPDVLLAVVEATGEERAAGPIHEALTALRTYLEERHEHKPVFLVALTKVDVLPPADAAPPYPPPKVAAIEHALGVLRKKLAKVVPSAESFLAVCGRPTDTPGAPRWNLDRLGEAIVEGLPEAAQIEAVRAFEVGRETKRRVARALVNSCSALAVTVGLAPIPFADAIVLLPMQAAMVTGIAYLSGRPWDRRATLEWLASIGVASSAGIGLRWSARQLLKLVPGAGSLVGAGVAGAGTMAIGRSAIAYFVDGPGSPSSRPELRADNPTA